MRRPNVATTSIPGVLLLQPERHEDHRGTFLDTFDDAWLGLLPPGTRFVRDARAWSRRAGTLRGLHNQRGLGKLVHVAHGAIHDVAVDLRQGSPSWGRHLGLTLTSTEGQLLWVPPDFAHGYLALEPDTVVHYRFTDAYRPDDERGVRWDDPDLAIAWPVDSAALVMSDRDRTLPLLRDLR